MINIKNFDSNFVKIDKKSYENIDIYYIGYITMKSISDYESSHSVNPFKVLIVYLIIGKVDGQTEEANGDTQYLLPQIKTKTY